MLIHFLQFAWQPALYFARARLYKSQAYVALPPDSNKGSTNNVMAFDMDGMGDGVVFVTMRMVGIVHFKQY